MRLFRLLRLAGEAEALRWRRTGRGAAIRATLGAGAAVFALLLLVMLHVAALAWLAPQWGAAGAALALAGADLLVVLLLVWLARRDQVDPIAIEAARVRDDALGAIGDQAARAAVLAPLLRSQSMKKGLIGAALTAAMVGLIARR
jgi:hypothetical protein